MWFDSQQRKKIFLPNVQTSSEAQPACYSWVQGLFLWAGEVKRLGRGAYHSPPSAAHIKSEWYQTMYLFIFSSILACVCVSINLCTRTVGLLTAYTWRNKAPLATLHQVSTSLISATRTGNRLMQTKICNGIILSVVHSKLTAWLTNAYNFWLHSTV